MNLLPTRPPSPSQDGLAHMAQGSEPVSPLPRASSFPHLADHDLGHTKERSHLEIVLDAQHLMLRRTGADVEPALLSGHVMLYLSEDTAIKEISLQFRGKARLPSPAPDSIMSPNTSTLTYVLYDHDWSFLEGDKRHARTLKAGHHSFPFQLQVESFLPSTIGTAVLGGASIAYKLRALAIRPGFGHNLHAEIPVFIHRSLGPEALEYQQTLEIENTWPDKLMYSIVVPHKAWAAGDTLTAILKFCPIAKGVHVVRITASIFETITIHTRGPAQERTHVATSTQYDIINGKAVPKRPRHNHAVSETSVNQFQNGVAGSISYEFPPTPRSPFLSPSFHIPSPPSSSPCPASIPSSPLAHTEEIPEEEDNEDTVIKITIPIPSNFIIPTHPIEPIISSHRVRWNIFIRNLDGHTSELRCSLPVHILDHHLLDEARSLSSATRRLVLGSPEESPGVEGDRELPSYSAHIRDRVANMFLSEGAVMRVTNPWVGRVNGSDICSEVDSFFSPPGSRARSGHTTPLEINSLSQLPHSPGPRAIATLDMLNSELAYSLSGAPRRGDFFGHEPRTPPEHSSHDSQPQSGHSSRPSSPEFLQYDSSSGRQSNGQGQGHGHHGHGHGHGHGRNLHNIIRATIKPFTALTHPHGLFSRHSSHHSHHGDHGHCSQRSCGSHTESPPGSLSRSQSTPALDRMNGEEILRRLLTEVPDYSIASRGFIGGVTPLESMRDLPPYEQVAMAEKDRE